jgi:hypothetical protein
MAQQPDDPTYTTSGSHQQQLLTPSELIQSVALLRKLHIVHSNDSDDVGDEESDEKRVEYCASVVRLVLAQGRRLEGIAGEVIQFATAFHSLAEPLAASALSPQQISNWPHVSAASESPIECNVATGSGSGVAFGGCAAGSAGELPNSAASFDNCRFSGEACATKQWHSHWHLPDATLRILSSWFGLNRSNPYMDEVSGTIALSVRFYISAAAAFEFSLSHSFLSLQIRSTFPHYRQDELRLLSNQTNLSCETIQAWVSEMRHMVAALPKDAAP